MKSNDEYLNDIHKLMDLGKGNLERLQHIVHVIKEGKIFYESDKNYLEKLIEKHLNKK